MKRIFFLSCIYIVVFNAVSAAKNEVRVSSVSDLPYELQREVLALVPWTVKIENLDIIQKNLLTECIDIRRQVSFLPERIKLFSEIPDIEVDRGVLEMEEALDSILPKSSQSSYSIVIPIQEIYAYLEVIEVHADKAVWSKGLVCYSCSEYGSGGNWQEDSCSDVQKLNSLNRKIKRTINELDFILDKLSEFLVKCDDSGIDVTTNISESELNVVRERIEKLLSLSCLFPYTHPAVTRSSTLDGFWVERAGAVHGIPVRLNNMYLCKLLSPPFI